MTIVLISIRAAALACVFLALLYSGRMLHVRRAKGWAWLTLGFGFATFGSLVSLGSFLPSLHLYSIFSNPELNAFVAEILGHVLGLCFISIGLLLWVPILYRFYHSERDLQKSERNLQAVMDSANEGIGIFQDGVLVFHNPRLEEMFGTTAEIIAARPFYEFIHEDDRQMVIDRYMARLQGHEVPSLYDYRVVKADGSIVWVLNSAAIMEWEGRPATLGMLTDITDRKLAQNEISEARENLEIKVKQRTAELNEANAQLVKLSDQKSSFVSAASHELRSPLTSILGFAALVRKTCKKHFVPLTQDSPKLAKKADTILANLEIIRMEGDRLTRLINDMLDLSKIEAGFMDWRDEPIDLDEVVKIVSAGAKVKLADKPDVELVVSSNGQSLEIIADRDRIVQVLTNLLDNAIKFTSQGEVAFSVRKVDEGMVELRVTDTGPGLSKEDHELVFQKYYQASSNCLGNVPKGTGLGLPICKEVIEHYNGSIGVEARESGSGASFFIRLPLMG